MSIGWFDPTAAAPGWFDEDGSPLGWFDEDLNQGAGGAASHDATGALAAAASTVAGSAEHATLHATSGALASQTATIAGSANHSAVHPSSGALAAQSSTLAGAAAHPHTTSGALSAAAATVSGAAAHQHASTGGLSAQAATLAGSADHTTAGASHATSAALAAQDATASGSATHLTLHAASGALQAGDATVVGFSAHSLGAPGPGFFASDVGLPGSTKPTPKTPRVKAPRVARTVEKITATVHDAVGALQADTASMSGGAARFYRSAGLLRSSLSDRDRLLRLMTSVDELLARDPGNAELRALSEQIDLERLNLIERELDAIAA